MRIKQLDLIRYGIFSGDAVEFPRSEQDFHFIVGPNEAGKSTIKTAISELLFGMPHSSSLDFVHHQSELKLGAALENSEGVLTFHRSKARKAPLTTSAGEPLPVDCLAPFLGVADKAFFEQMFCLDHTALIKGGQSILDAASDVGQVLFQSAAGIASLGRVRDELAEEADRLWAKRKSNDRAYYVGQRQLDDANVELKAAMVRTSAWRAAHSAVEDVEERRNTEERLHRTLELKRGQLERIRRLAPHLNVWRDKTAELGALGEVLDLPADAEAILNAAMTKLAVAEGTLKVHRESAEELRANLDGIFVDGALLSLKADIQGLEATRHQCRSHGQEIAGLEQQVRHLLREVSDRCTELGWPEDEEGARTARPSSLALQAVSSLMLSRGKLELGATTAEQSVNDKLADIENLTKYLQAAPNAEVPIALQTSLRTAQKYRDTQVSQRRLKGELGDAESALEESLAALGKWSRSTSELRSMTLPSSERISSLRSERQELLSYAQVHDLSGYSARVESIGIEKPYYSPYIAKKKEDDGWFPENVLPMVVYQPQDGGEPIAVPTSKPAVEKLKKDVQAAEAKGESNINVPWLPRPISVEEAKKIVTTFEDVFAAVNSGKPFDPEKRPSRNDIGPKKQLVLRANIQALEYEEMRREALQSVPAEPRLPKSIRPEYMLLPHQRIGLAWLQHLFSLQTDYQVRGAV